MKRILAMAITGALMVGAFTGCSKDDSTSEGGAKPTGKTVDIFQLKVEIDEPLKKLAAQYEKETGTKVNVRSVGGGSDYGASLKAEFQSGNEPDIFIVAGKGDLEVWKDKLEDLTDQPWKDNAVKGTLDTVTVDGKIYGMPVATEGYGLIYNKNLFEKAGINPADITTLDKLNEACKTLESKKADLGIEVPISYTTKESWVTGNHTFNIALAHQENPIQFVEDYKAGKADITKNDAFKNWTNLVDTLVKYSQKDLDVVDYNTQLSDFALGKTAMLHQGNWTSTELSKLEVDFDMGFLPLPIDSSTKSAYLPVGVPMYWAVNKDSADKTEAKAFLNWMVSSEEGQTSLVKDMAMIPAFTNFKVQSEDPLAKSVAEYNNAGKTLPWAFTNLPDGFTMEKIGPLFSDYAKGKINKDTFLKNINDAIK